MKKYLPINKMILFSLCFVFLAGCSSVRIGNKLDVKDKDYPIINNQTNQTAILHGKISSSLNVEVYSVYNANQYSDCDYAPSSFLARNMEGASFPLQLKIPLSVERSEGKFSTKFVIDYFQPGRCNWHFTGVLVTISKGELKNPSEWVVSRSSGLSSNSQESWSMNSLDIPVVLRCNFSKLENLPKGRMLNACMGGWSKKEKQAHLLTSGIKNVGLDIIDNESE